MFSAGGGFVVRLLDVSSSLLNVINKGFRSHDDLGTGHFKYLSTEVR